MQSTGSISRGRPAEKHNTRECYRDAASTPPNIDRERMADNIVLANRDLASMYEELFGDATREYNALQVAKGHPERQVGDYLEKVRSDKKLQPMYEFVVQLGNVDERPPSDVACRVYEEWLDAFNERCGSNFAVKQAVIHLDEATPHMHLEVVPHASSGRGLPVQNSMNKAIAQAGFDGYKDMLKEWDALLTECMRGHGIDRVAGERDRQMGGIDIESYKRSMAIRENSRTLEKLSEQLEDGIDEKLARLSSLAAERDALAADVSAAAARLECLQREEAEAGKAVEGLEGIVAELEEETRQVRTEIERFDGLLGVSEEAVREAERGTDVLAERIDALERRVEGLGGSLRRAQERVREYVPMVVGRAVLATSRAVFACLESLGVPVANSREFRNEMGPIAERARQAQEAVRPPKSRTRDMDLGLEL